MFAVILSAKVMSKTISAMIKIGQLQSPSIEYRYLFLNLFNSELAYNWIPLLVCPYFCSLGCPATLNTQFSPMWWEALQAKSQVSYLRTQYKDPWVGLESRPIDLECTTLTTGPLYYTSYNTVHRKPLKITFYLVVLPGGISIIW